MRQPLRLAISHTGQHQRSPPRHEGVNDEKLILKRENRLEDRSWLFAQPATNILKGVALGAAARDGLDRFVIGSRDGARKQPGGLEAHHSELGGYTRVDFDK